MPATVIIPARFASTRFPGKMIAADTGKPLVQHVVEQAKKARRIRNVIVATDDSRIVEALTPFGTVVTKTLFDHPSGTDRIWEVAREWPGEMIVNVQGDEPEINPQTIDALVDRMESSDDDMATAATPFPAGADVNDPNLVKVVIGNDGHAIYFSRCPIPFRREPESADNSAYHLQPPYYLHLGVYAYRWEFLRDFTSWKPGVLERTEKLEQLRALEHGRTIGVIKVDRATHGIDTPEQYAEFVIRQKLTGFGDRGSGLG